MKLIVAGAAAAVLSPAVAVAQTGADAARAEIKTRLESVRAPMYRSSGAVLPGVTATYSVATTGCNTRLETSYPSHQIDSTSHPARTDRADIAWGSVRTTRLSDNYVVVQAPNQPANGRYFFGGPAATQLKAAIDRLVLACGGTTVAPPPPAPPAPPVSAASPAIRIESVPGKGYAAVVSAFPVEQVQPVSNRIAAMARQRCGKLTTRFGRFKYFTGPGAKGAAEYQNYRQSFSCIDPATDPYKPAPADWKPAAQDEKDLMEFAKRYMRAVDEADYVAGMPMMEPVIEIEKDEWMDVPSKLDQFGGGGGKWTLTITGWVNNPDGASHPGSYALVTINGTYPKLAVYCGNLFIYRQRAGSYLVSQQNLRVIPQQWIDSGQMTKSQALKTCEN